MSTNPDAEPKRISPAWIALLIFAVFLLIRLPFRADFLLNWDSVNFALGTQLFDLEHHQPHPPGYIGYVALGWLVSQFTGEANASLTLLSALSGAAAPAAFFLLASLFLTRGYALMTSVLLGVSPVVWYYSSVALSYSVELALGLFFLWAGYVARKRLSLSHLVAATVLLVVLGAVRQTGGLLLTPLWLYLVWAFPWQERLRAGAVLVAGNLAWLIPLFWMSGGVGAFFRFLGEQTALAVAPTSIFAMDAGGLTQNLILVGFGVALGLNFGLLVILASAFRGREAYRVFRRDAPFFALWLLPALVTYLFLHTGQVGYVLLILPLLFLVLGVALRGLMEGSRAGVGPEEASVPAEAVGDGSAEAGAFGAPAGLAGAVRYVAVGVVALLALGSAGLFFSVPPVIALTAYGNPAEMEQKRAEGIRGFLPAYRLSGIAGGYFTEGWRQYDIRANDRHWRELTRFVRSFDEERTVVLTTPDPGGSFRHLTYYAPEHRVYGIGRTLHGDYGHLFTAADGTSDYRVAGLQAADDELLLPDNVDRLVLPDAEVRDALMAHGHDLHVETVRLDHGHPVLVAHVPPGATLSFQEATAAEPRVAVLEERATTVDD